MQRYLSHIEQNLKIEIQKPLSYIEQNSEIKNLIIHLTTLLKKQNKDLNIAAIQLNEDSNTLEEDKKEDLMKILATKMNSANAVNYN